MVFGWLILVVVLLASGLLVQTLLFKLVGGTIGGIDLTWTQAAVTVIFGAVAQSVLTGMFLGADGGCIGTLFGLAVWAGVVALRHDVPWGRALILGLIMNVVLAAMILGGVLFGVGGLIAAAAL